MINFYKLYNKPKQLLFHSVYYHLLSKLVRCGMGMISKDEYPNCMNIIRREPYYAYQYARDVLKGRWVEAEPYIMKDRIAAHDYAKYVIGGRWLEYEPELINTNNAYSCYMYAKEVIKGPWPEAEPVIFEVAGWRWSYDRFLKGIIVKIADLVGIYD